MKKLIVPATASRRFFSISALCVMFTVVPEDLLYSFTSFVSWANGMLMPPRAVSLPFAAMRKEITLPFLNDGIPAGIGLAAGTPARPVCFVEVTEATFNLNVSRTENPP